MKLTKKAIATLTLAAVILLGTHTGFTHPNGDASSSVSWSFHAGVQNKIQRALEKSDIYSVGLSYQDQKLLDRYGIKVGRSFFTRIDNARVLLKRNTTGVQIVKTEALHADSPAIEIPFQKIPVSTKVGFDPNNGHFNQNHAWVFDAVLTSRIIRHLEKGDQSVAVGLNTTEQKMLGKYGIQVGNSFQTVIDGIFCTVKRTSLGLQVEIMTPESEVKIPAPNNASADQG